MLRALASLRVWTRIAVAIVLLAGALGAVAAPAAADYSRTGAFAWGGDKPADEITIFRNAGIVRDQATGLPKVLYGGVPHWNTVTVSLFGLQHFNRYVLYGRRSGLRRAMLAADWLVRNQPPDGAWRYRMTFPYPRLGVLSPPWIAAQAQGNAMSLLVRVYAATGRAKYLATARAARRPFQRPLERRGIRRVVLGRTFFEGFPTAQPSLALEDFQLALLGLYDLARYDDQARALWREGMGTLAWALPLYEAGVGRPQFDFAHRAVGVAPLYSVGAHAFNAKLLKLLSKRARSATGRLYANRWLTSLPE